jgi:cyclohexa-1,5-dienecarbonyl-CoA hydratase
MSASAGAVPVRRETQRGGEIERLVLDRPKGNVLDREMIGALRGGLRDLATNCRNTKLVVFEGAGEHFSFGASVPEHLPGRVEELLPAFHGLFRDVEALGIPTAAVVRGQCLGGGFELAIWCGRVFVETTGRLGVPETRLGVFPPVAAIALPWRVSGAAATQLILSGEVVEASAAAQRGLVDACVPDAEAALQAWFDETLAGKSAVAVRAAWRAARLPMADALERVLPRLEKQYLEDLMAHRDPTEGLEAFLARRSPFWTHQ